MSIRHVVLMRFQPGTEPAAIESLTSALRALPGQIPEISGYLVGSDLDLADGNWDFAVTADFTSIENFHVYRDHPSHLAVIRDLIAPHLAERAAVQFTT